MRLITDAAGNVVTRYDYQPFGMTLQAQSAGDTNRLLFTGQERDRETSAVGWEPMDYFKAREYQSWIGRFTQPDDTGFGHPFEPQSMNLYSYALGNPLGFLDPTGHQSVQSGVCDTGECEDVSPQSDLFQLLWHSLESAASVAPVVGPGLEAYHDAANACIQGAALNAALAASDLMLLKSAAVGVARGAWKFGSNAWTTTRRWYGKSRGLAFGQHVHHWLIPQSSAIPTMVKNQPWNLMAIQPPAGVTYAGWHAGIHGKGEYAMGLAGRLVHGTPAWTKSLAASASGRLASTVEWLNCR